MTGLPWQQAARDWQARRDAARLAEAQRERDLLAQLEARLEAQQQDGRQAREAQARDALELLTAAGLRERISALETALRATEAALAVCEEAGGQRLGDVPGWPGKLRAALGTDPGC